MNANNELAHLPFGEFIPLLALMISLVALAIDAMLPALPAIGADLGITHSNDNQLIISVLFLGLAVGQTIYGPLSDSIGRKSAIYVGLVFFMLGCLLSILAANFPIMLAGRFLQGIGAAGPRIVTVALVRDCYEGREMARVMSFVMGVFILVPALAPALGQGVLIIANWQAIFGSFLALALIAFIWFAIRQPETLPPERRVPFSLKRLAMAIRETCSNRKAFGYTIAAGLIFGAFVGYLNSAQQIFQEQYALGAQFPVYFAVLALAIGAASYVNARLVIRHGMELLSSLALLVLTGLSIVFVIVVFLASGNPPLWVLMAYFIASFFCIGILFGNFNALAMAPLGHIAGAAAAVIGSLTTFISLVLGTAIGQSYNGTVLPLVGGFAILGVGAIGFMQWAEKERAEKS